MRKLITFFSLFFSLYLNAAIPAGYYSSAEGKNTEALRSALQTILSNGTTDVGYGGLWTAYAITDLNSSGKIWDMYSNCSFTYSTAQCGTYSSECNCYNREHTSPESWFAEASPMVSDLFNVYPTDGKVNGERSNYPYGEVSTATYTSDNGSKLGESGFTGYNGVVFEPIDEYKGDFARTYFYMATRYADVCQSWSSGAEVVYGSNLGFTSYAMNLFLKWSREDPVSAKELARNEAVYGIQYNRNPFIDFPGLEEYIWGTKTTQAFSSSAPTVSYLTSPSTGTTIDFGKVAYQHTDTTSVYIKAANLTGDLTLSLNGTNAGYFSLPFTTLSKADAEVGYKLIITYAAQAIGSQVAQLEITGGGITNTQVSLNATATDQFMALPASGITDNSFTANWSSSVNATGYSLNVFSIAGNSSKTILEQDFLSGLPTGWVSEGYTDNATAGTMKLASGKNYGKITTPAIDLSATTSVLTVIAKQFGSDAGAKLTVRVNGDSLTAFTTTVDYQTFTLNIPVKTSTTTIALSAVIGGRLYIDYVKVATQSTEQIPVTVNGYPKSVGNVLTCPVTGLQSDSTYYYTVTPEGNSTTVSDQIRIHTTKTNNEVVQQKGNIIFWSATNNGIQIQNLPVDCKVSLLDMMGRPVREFQNSTSETMIVLSQRGIYLLQIKQNQEFNTYKIRY
jgi:endonuclease I